MKIKVPFNDLKKQYLELKTEIDLVIKDVIKNIRENGYNIIDQIDNFELSQNSGFLKFINQKYLLISFSLFIKI